MIQSSSTHNLSIRHAGALAAVAALSSALVLWGTSLPAHAAATCDTSADLVTCVFSYSGAAEIWTAPPGVTTVAADLLGAQGGSITTFTVGGSGGRATASVPVTPGSQLIVTVGGRGGSVPGCDGLDTPALGGFNGGGNGGGTTGGCRAAGGGGATDLRSNGGSLDDRIIVAGGGGGSANALSVSPFNGGAGGGLVGLNGGPDATGGAGGDQAGGGSGLPGRGSDGSPTAGFLEGAGGGGGGYYGGAGGRDFANNGRTSFGGGGGSGFGPASTVYETGVRTGNGEARVSFPAVLLSAQQFSQLTPTSGVLSVTVDPNGRVGLPVRIVYGTSPDALTSVLDVGPISGTAPVVVSGVANNMIAQTTYYFQALVPGDPSTAPLDVTEFVTTARNSPAAVLPQMGVSDASVPTLVALVSLVLGAGIVTVIRTRRSSRR